MKNDDSVFCPLIDRNIDIVDCMENRDTKEASIPAEYKAKSNWELLYKGWFTLPTTLHRLTVHLWQNGKSAQERRHICNGA